jgi:hypothetical protein
MDLDNTVELGAALLILVLLGFVTGQLLGRGRTASGVLEALVGHVAVPALIFMIVSDARIEDIGSISFVLAAAFAFYLTFMVMFVVAVVAGRAPVGEATIEAAAASHGSAGLIGIPLAAILFGFEAALGAVLVFATGVVVEALSVGVIQVAVRPGLARRALWSLVRSVALDPKMLAVGAGVVAAEFTPTLPAIAVNALDILGQGALAMAFLALGARVGRGERGRIGPEAPIIALVKLVVSPAVMLAVLIGFGGFDRVWISLAVLLAALPSAPGLAATARRFEADPAGPQAAVRVTTIVSLVTVPALALALAHGAVPLSTSELLAQW